MPIQRILRSGQIWGTTAIFPAKRTRSLHSERNSCRKREGGFTCGLDCGRSGPDLKLGNDFFVVARCQAPQNVSRDVNAHTAHTAVTEHEVADVLMVAAEVVEVRVSR